MSVTSVDKDFDTLTLTLTADFAARTEQVWELWSDPRSLERWWGPPTHPATFEEHDLTPGGTVTYYMTGPEGEKYRGWWRINAVESGSFLEFDDGFADESGTPDESMPVTAVRMDLIPHDSGTRMELRSRFDSREQMEQLDQMGMTEGLTLAVGQMDGLLGA